MGMTPMPHIQGAQPTGKRDTAHHCGGRGKGSWAHSPARGSLVKLPFPNVLEGEG